MRSVYQSAWAISVRFTPYKTFSVALAQFRFAVGAPLSGILSDRLVIKWRKRRGGKWVPEDRLRATIPGALVMVPVSVLLCGFTTQYISGRLGLGLNCVWLLMNGLGVRHIPYIYLISWQSQGPALIGGFRAQPSFRILRGYPPRSQRRSDRGQHVRRILLYSRGLCLMLAQGIPTFLHGGVGFRNSSRDPYSWPCKYLHDPCRFGVDRLRVGHGPAALNKATLTSKYSLLWAVIRHGDALRAYVDLGFSTPLNN